MGASGVRSVLVAAACVAALVASLVACDENGGSAPGPRASARPATPAPTIAPTTTAAPVADGVLRIGLLLPASGEEAAIGQPLIDAALVAAEAVNTGGGVLGRQLEIVTDFDEGTSASSARDAIEGLVERDVDAVVGPASSTVALATLDDLMSAGILTCSPTASALALDDYPSSDLFVRTVPSDSLQAAELARLADDTGARSAAVAHLDDPYGRALASVTVDALKGRGLDVRVEVPFGAQDEIFADEAAELTGSDAGVIVVIGDGEQGPRLLSALGDRIGIAPGERQPDIVVNDGMRRPPSPQVIQDLADDVRQRIVGVSPLAFGTVDGEPPGAFATNAADCVTLIALAAVSARSDDGEAMRAEIVDITDGGINCRSFAACVELIDDNRRIDYDGPGGVVQLGEEGDPVAARFDRFAFDDAGVDVSVSASGQPDVPS